MESVPATDTVLVERLQAGDESALAGLMTRHQGPLFYFVLRYHSNETIAREIVQETFVRAYFHIRDYRPTASFKTWLYQIAVNLCRDHARRMSRRPILASIYEVLKPGSSQPLGNVLTDDGLNPAEKMEAAERHALVESTIAELPKELREALLLFAFEEFSQKECAEVLGVSPKAVELRVYRAKKIISLKLHPMLNINV
jgi:RNA polymerase sigma-70 factor (ECF subfamily)